MAQNANRFRLKRAKIKPTGKLIGLALLLYVGHMECQEQKLQVAHQVATSTNSKIGEAPNKQPPNQPEGGQKSLACQYEKGHWQECTADGFQIKVQQLKSLSQADDCEPAKRIRRDCKPVGCKYIRGQWSSKCDNGQRVRIDQLAKGPTGAQAANCKLHRRVTKDCRRACHYFKSAWSECSNGLQTRNLTLSEGSGAKRSLAQAARLEEAGDRASGSRVALKRRKSGQFVTSISALGKSCAKLKQTKRECRTIAAGQTAANLSSTALAAQRRRLKQLRAKQQHRQQKQATSSASSSHSQQTSSSSNKERR